MPAAAERKRTEEDQPPLPLPSSLPPPPKAIETHRSIATPPPSKPAPLPRSTRSAGNVNAERKQPQRPPRNVSAASIGTHQLASAANGEKRNGDLDGNANLITKKESIVHRTVKQVKQRCNALRETTGRPRRSSESNSDCGKPDVTARIGEFVRSRLRSLSRGRRASYDLVPEFSEKEPTNPNTDSKGTVNGNWWPTASRISRHESKRERKLHSVIADNGWLDFTPPASVSVRNRGPDCL